MSAEIIHGDCLDVLASGALAGVGAVVSDPPYGMRWNTDTARFSGGHNPARRSAGRNDRKRVAGDDEPFDPTPWLGFPRVVLFGSNHFASRLPTGTTLVWIKRSDAAFGTFLSDAEIAWQKGGHGVYCLRDTSINSLAQRREHPTQKPVSLMRWAIRRLRLSPNSLILDPYCGSGSTGVAAIEEGHRFIGIEREAEYVEIARRRIAAAQAQLTLGVA
jgi:site-specific DNA-methyltransferase (adenine-specific)